MMVGIEPEQLLNYLDDEFVTDDDTYWFNDKGVRKLD
jgi:hypothetical protein